MFQERLRTVREHIQTVRSIIITSKNLREILFQVSEKDNSNSEVLALKESAPSLNNWQIYDHCSVVTRLYAIYENFVEDIVTDWIVLLPTLFPNYSDLAEEVRSTHQSGVAQLLLELKKKKKSRFEHLSVEEVIRGLFLGISNSDNQYDLVPEAFLLHDQNLRKEALEKLFAEAGIPKVWNWIEKHQDMKYFIEEVRANENTPEGELKQLIDYRNESAHGSVISFLDANTLIEFCSFVETLCRVLSELITYKILEKRKSSGQIKQIGKITEWFKKPNAGVATFKNINLSIGDRVFLVNEGISYCQLAIVQSLQINGENQKEVKITDEIEVGLQFDIQARKNLIVYVDNL